MKNKIILKNFHRPLQLLPPCLSFISRRKKFGISRIFSFTDSCRYTLDNGDQGDWNKLFGFCYGWKGIHQNSARIVWRYLPASDMIELATYFYIKGTRTYKIIAKAIIGKNYYMTINRDGDYVTVYFESKEVDRVKFDSTQTAFGCGLYFGGNRRAPHKITIQIEEL